MHLSLILAVVFAWLAILAGAWLGWQLLRQNGRLLLRLEALEEFLNELELGEPVAPTGLPFGSPAPEFELTDLAGETKTLAQYRGQPVLLIFFNPACGYCREMAPKLAALTRGRGSSGRWPVSPGDAPAGAVEAVRNDNEFQNVGAAKAIAGSPNATGESPAPPFLLILSSGDAEVNRQFFAEHQVNCPVLLQNGSRAAVAYQASGTPSGYLISPEGQIASELAMGADALQALAVGKSEIAQGLHTPAGTEGNGRADRFKDRSLARSRIKRDGLKAGTLAPDFHLPRLDGRGDLTLRELRGKRVLLVFSSPHCGPCNALAPELESFHRGHPQLEMVMIGKGEPRENRAKVKEHGLTFPVVLQQQWEISRRYGMFATPIAYLIDEAGIITRDVAVGAEPILALLASATEPPARSIPV